jgi:hypothetical protein
VKSDPVRTRAHRGSLCGVNHAGSDAHAAMVRVGVHGKHVRDDVGQSVRSGVVRGVPETTTTHDGPGLFDAERHDLTRSQPRNEPSAKARQVPVEDIRGRTADLEQHRPAVLQQHGHIAHVEPS